MSLVIQNEYLTGFKKGLAGQIAKPNMPSYIENNNMIAGEALNAGDGVMLDPTSKTFRKPKTVAEIGQVVGVVHHRNFAENIINTGDNFELVMEGFVYVTVSEAVTRFKQANSSMDGTGTWTTDKTPATVAINPMVYMEDGAKGDLVCVKINGLVL